MFQVLVEDSDAELEHADLENSGLVENYGMPWEAEEKPRHSRLAKLASGVLALLAVGMLLIAWPASQTSAGPIKADVQANTRLNLAGYEAAAKSMEAIGSFGAHIEAADTWVETTNFTELLSAEGLKQQALTLVGLDGLQLRRRNSLHDGNPCPDDEEEHGGLCYQTCNKLTNGRYPIRTTAFSCCMKEPCSFFNSKFTNPLKICQGYDVGGHDKYGCPHSPGDCLLNEEFHMGLCFKQCAVLTDNEYPYRSSATTCCKQNAYLPCLEMENLWSDANFTVGGGFGDEVLEEQAGQVHPPIAELAEK